MSKMKVLPKSAPRSINELLTTLEEALPYITGIDVDAFFNPYAPYVAGKESNQGCDQISVYFYNGSDIIDVFYLTFNPSETYIRVLTAINENFDTHPNSMYMLSTRASAKYRAKPFSR